MASPGPAAAWSPHVSCLWPSSRSYWDAGAVNMSYKRQRRTPYSGPVGSGTWLRLLAGSLAPCRIFHGGGMGGSRTWGRGVAWPGSTGEKKKSHACWPTQEPVLVPPPRRARKRVKPGVCTTNLAHAIAPVPYAIARLPEPSPKCESGWRVCGRGLGLGLGLGDGDGTRSWSAWVHVYLSTRPYELSFGRTVRI